MAHEDACARMRPSVGAWSRLLGPRQELGGGRRRSTDDARIG